MCNTRDKILDVAESLIQNVGLNAMSYKHISDAVGIQKPSIHHHFPKKENLVNELLMRCHISYGNNYQEIVNQNALAPEKLRQISDVFLDGLNQGQLCLIGAIASDLNTLQESSSHILQETVKKTVDIFSEAFSQGVEEGSLQLTRSENDTAYAFFSFLIGAQITARAHGGEAYFKRASESMISSWEK